LFDLHDELIALVDAVDDADLDYALCGGLAMSVYGIDRSTNNIDILISPEDAPKLRTVAEKMGYTIEVDPMTFADGAVEMRKFIRRDKESRGAQALKALLVTPDITRVWTKRECHDWEHRRLCLVSRWGLIELKSLRRNPRDLEDIAALREPVEY